MMNLQKWDAFITATCLTHRLQGTDVTFGEHKITGLFAESTGYPVRLQHPATDLYGSFA